jgi:hypothetical protein
MITSTAARFALETYKEIACGIVDRHVQKLSNGAFADKNEPAKEVILVFNRQVKMINEELSVQADYILSQTKLGMDTDKGKLKELLFLIRKDYFNEFLKKCELSLQ